MQRDDEHKSGSLDAIDAGSQAGNFAPEYDPSPSRFREAHPEDQFVGSSGVLFEQAMAQTRMAICLCDPHQPDMPIVFANRAFRELTGYLDEDIVGQNCRFLQGPDTDEKEIAKIREALISEDVTVVELLNYRKDGSTFWNALHIGPIYNTKGDLLYFFGSQWDVSDVRAARAEELYARDMARELSHRMKNMFSVISGIVNITGRLRGAEDVSREINERVQALGRAYETTLDEASSGNIEIGPAIRAILQPYEMGNAHLKLEGNGLKVPFAVVSGVGLALHELAANATKYGAWASPDGSVTVDWYKQEDDEGVHLHIDWIESGGPRLDPEKDRQGRGNAIIDRMIGYAGGSVERDWQADGLKVQIVMPIHKRPSA